MNVTKLKYRFSGLVYKATSWAFLSLIPLEKRNGGKTKFMGKHLFIMAKNCLCIDGNTLVLFFFFLYMEVAMTTISY